MSTSSNAAPSRKLMFVLFASLVLAALTVGRTYLGAGSDEDPDEFLEIYEPFDDVGSERIVIDVWDLPESPRDPFLQVELSGPAPLADVVDQ